MWSEGVGRASGHGEEFIFAIYRMGRSFPQVMGEKGRHRGRRDGWTGKLADWAVMLPCASGDSVRTRVRGACRCVHMCAHGGLTYVGACTCVCGHPQKLRIIRWSVSRMCCVPFPPAHNGRPSQRGSVRLPRLLLSAWNQQEGCGAIPRG